MPLRVRIAVWATLLSILGFVLACFAFQNADRTARLSLNLGFGAWEFVEPAPVPLLLIGGTAGGLLLGLAAGGLRSFSLKRRVEQLEREAALRELSPAKGKSADAW